MEHIMLTAEEHIARIDAAGYPVTGIHRQRDVWLASARVAANQFSMSHGSTLTEALAALEKL